MIWLITKERSINVASCNVHKEGDSYQLWVTYASNKSIKLKESKDEDEINLIKEAIDFAIENNDPVLRL